MAFEDQCKIIEKHLRGTDMGCAYETALSIVHQAIADGYLLFKPNLNNNIIEIEPGIIMSKLDIKDGDNIIVTLDPDIYRVEVAPEICRIVSEQFPNNNVTVTFKGVEIDKLKGKEV